MGEGELVPLPLFRCPCRRHVRPRWGIFVRELLSFDSYELPSSIRVYSNVVGLLRIVLIVIVFLLYVWYQIYVTKGYLERAAILGVSRLQLQHPTTNHCNPMDPGCRQDLRKFTDLPYCSQATMADAARSAKRHPCKHYDAFEISSLEVGAGQVLLPTRRTTLEQKVLCDGSSDDCTQLYENTAESTLYVADAESWTLLVDHSFACNELDTSLAAWGMQGFYVPCLEGSVSGGSRAEKSGEECTRIPIMPMNGFEGRKTATLTSELSKEIRDIWAPGVEPELVPPFKEIEAGDVIQVGELLKRLHINLDEELKSGPHKGSTLRHEGLVLILEIVYHNYKPYSFPNRLPPIYEYNFKVSPVSEFKVMQALDAPNGNRLIDDRHGINFIVQQRGTLGMTSKREVVLMLVEFCILLGLVKWFTALLALNWYRGIPGDEFEEHLVRGVLLKTGKAFSPYDDLRDQEMTERSDGSDSTDSGQRESIVQRASHRQ